MHESSSQRLGLYNGSAEVGMAGGPVSPIVEAARKHDVTLPLWGIRTSLSFRLTAFFLHVHFLQLNNADAGRFTDGLYNVFLSVEHPLFIVQYAYTMLTHFLSEPQYDLPEYVEFKKRLWNYLNYFDWLDVYWYPGSTHTHTHNTTSHGQTYPHAPPRTQ